jgi:hypothetical protein
VGPDTSPDDILQNCHHPNTKLRAGDKPKYGPFYLIVYGVHPPWTTSILARTITLNLESAAKWMHQRKPSRSKGSLLMRRQLLALVALGVMAATDAFAQEVNLSGPYQCVVNRAGAGPATVTQNGWDLNLVNEIGVPSRAWVDWPGHIWAQSSNEGAIYSPDGMTIQFDRGTVWHRILPQPVLHSGG